MVKMVSPDELITEAKKQMIEGREPETFEDWSLVMNFIARNIEYSSAPTACQLIARIYKMPLNDQQVEAIVLYQRARRTKPGEGGVDAKVAWKP